MGWGWGGVGAIVDGGSQGRSGYNFVKIVACSLWGPVKPSTYSPSFSNKNAQRAGYNFHKIVACFSSRVRQGSAGSAGSAVSAAEDYFHFETPAARSRTHRKH